MPDDRETDAEAVTEPAKLLRVAGMAEQLLDELHQTQHDGAGRAARARADTAYQDSLRELRGALSSDLGRELERLAAPLRDPDVVPSESELRIAEAQLSGWLEGLVQGMQAGAAVRQTAAQLDAAQQRLQEEPRQDQRGYR